MYTKLLVSLVVIIGSVLAVDPEFTSCSDADICAINEVHIDPCKSKKVCTLRKSENASISFNFVPNFSAKTLKTMIAWDKNGEDLDFVGMNTNACEFTKCPIEQNKEQTFDYSLHLGAKLPTGTFPIKWKLWNEQDESQMCCFKTTIRIRR